jgi:pilus assembly protein Flp/PilA
VRAGLGCVGPTRATLQEKNMSNSNQPGKLRSLRAWFWKVCGDPCGQDMIEYALMAGAVALACAAATPNVTGSFSTIFSKINSAVLAHGGQ